MDVIVTVDVAGASYQPLGQDDGQDYSKIRDEEEDAYKDEEYGVYQLKDAFQLAKRVLYLDGREDR